MSDHKNKLINSISGAFSGAVVSVALCPIEVIRMRIMVNHIHDHGLFQTGFRMIKNEGIKSLYKGLGTTMVGLVANWGVYFTAYEFSKEKYQNYKPIQKNILSSITAGGITAIITSPIWVIRTRMMTQVGEKGYQSLSHAFSSIYQKEGIRGYYHGLLPSLLGLVHVGIQFPLYEFIKQKRAPNQNPNLTDILLASSISKFVASIVAYPHEVLRSRLQDQGHGDRTSSNKTHHRLKYDGLLHAIELTYKEGGIKGFYKGLTTNLVRVVPSAAITLATFEFTSRQLRKYL